MNLNRTLSLLATTLCAFAFLFTTATASAAPAKPAGTVKAEGSVTVKINGKTAGNGAEVKIGDYLETGSESVNVLLVSGQEYVIDPGSKVRFVKSANGAVAILVLYGGIHLVGSESEYVDPLPWLAAFANGNSSFPSIGGVGGRTISTVLPGGQVIYTTVSN